MLRIGIAGCGWAGERHREAIAATDRATLAAIAEADPEVRATRASEWDTDAYAHYADMLASMDLDALVIALPHHLHEDAAIRAAEAGVSVLCEKPMARTVAEADAMLDAAVDAGVELVVAESARYEPWVRTVEELIADGALGHPVFADYNWLHAFGGYGYDRAEWLNDPERLGGGQWLLNGVHHVSPLRGWFAAGGAGDVDTIFAREFRTPGYDAPEGIEASVGVTFAFEGGETATLRMAMEVPHHDRFNIIRIHGTDGTVEVDHDKEQVTVDGDESETVVVEDGDAFVDQMTAFVDCLVEGTETRTGGRRERNTLSVIEAGYESMERGQSVDVDYREG